MRANHREIRMPDLSATDSQVNIVRWLIKVGGPVERGQPLVEVETDKAVMKVESSASGTLAQICANAGETVDVGQVIALIESVDRARPPMQPDSK